MTTRLNGHDLTRSGRWPIADGEVFYNITAEPGVAGPILVHLEAFLSHPAGRKGPFVRPEDWGERLHDLMGGTPSVVISAPLPKTDRDSCPFIDIDSKTITISLGATTPKARLNLRELLRAAIAAIATPADERRAR